MEATATAYAGDAPDRAAGMGREGRARAFMSFDMMHMVRCYEALYGKLLAMKGDGQRGKPYCESPNPNGPRARI